MQQRVRIEDKAIGDGMSVRIEKYSVLMTVYEKDNPDFFSFALDSIVQQTLTPDEIVLVCDGDLTKRQNQIIENYIKQYGKLLHVIRLSKNKGLWNALNVGLRVCRNEFVARMDADDIAKPERCEIQLKVFQKNPNLEYLGSYVEEFVETPEQVISVRKVPSSRREIEHFAQRRNPFNHPSVMYKKTAVLMVGGYREMKRCEDYDLAVRLIMNGVNCGNIPLSLLYYRLTEDSFARRRNWNNTKGFISVRYTNWRRGFCSFLDFFITSLVQLFLFCMPITVTKYLYQKVLR